MKEALGAILKIAGFILILPLIAACCITFQNHLLSLPVKKEAYLLWGAGTYIALNLFVYDFKNVFDFGKSYVDKWLAFFKPAGYVVPVYSIILIILYEIAILLGHGFSLQSYFLFAIAFTLMMHLVLTAHDIYESDNSLLKAHYLLSFGAVLIVSLFFISLLFAMVISEYSFISFFNSLATHTSHYYKSIYKTFFVDYSN